MENLYSYITHYRFAMIQWWKLQHQKRPVTLVVLKVFSLLFLLSLLAVWGFLTSIAWGAFGPLPDREDLSKIEAPVASEVYANDGTLLGRYYFENRSNLKYADISPAFIETLVATEDARFFEHSGVDFRAWGRVIFKSLLMKDRSSGGGSTLSQQLSKNLFPRDEYQYASLLMNKLKEVMIARRLERLYTKEEILELYLNTVPFSENTFGLKVAANRFFNTAPKNLDYNQSAILVAMLKATSTYNPVSSPDRSVERRNLVFDQLVKYGYLGTAKADSLKAEPLCLDYAPMNNNEGLATYFREHLRLEIKHLLKDLRQENGMGYNLYTDGLKIYTTLDAKMQQFAEEAVAEHMQQLQKDFIAHLHGQDAWEQEIVLALAKVQSNRYKVLEKRGFTDCEIDSVFLEPVVMRVFSWDGREQVLEMSPLDSIKYYLSFLNAGFLAANPSSGAIQAWVGGIEHKYFKYDHVKSRRQVGSTFKPVVYTAAIRKGIHPCSYTSNHLRTYAQYEGWRPRNADNKYGGMYSMEGGLINSINTVTVNLAMRAKPYKVAQLATELGFPENIPGVPAIALGAVEANLLEMVRVYSTFANRGVQPRLHYLDRIETTEGAVLLDFRPVNADLCAQQVVLEEEEADMINEMLQSAVDHGTGQRLRWKYKFTNELAGKTGTSQHHSDGWFMGYNPELVAGTWVGAESPAVRFRNLRLGQGANTALPVFALFMQKMQQSGNFQKITKASFPEPAQIVQDQLNCPRIKWPEVPKEEFAEETPATDIAAVPAATAPVPGAAATVGEQDE
ncbi:MAG: transglycosylase domain-containing protein [Phaeodactylibacter sp.]|nr:transglycosylase domain-containing protein [Phaeodactylibacter sp.]